MVATRRLLAVCLLAVAVFSAQADDTELKVFRLQHQDAENLIPVLRPLLGPVGAISGRGDRLLIRDTEARIAQIAEALAALDVPARRLRITVRYAGAGEPPPAAAKDEIVRHYGTTDDTGEQFITVSDGHTAFVQVGKQLTDVRYFLELAEDRVLVAPDVRYRTVTTGFSVTPHLHQREVELEVTPRMAFVGERGQRTVIFHELATRVRARLGHWIRLGGNGTAAGDAVSGGILRHWRTDTPEARVMWLKVESVEP